MEDWINIEDEKPIFNDDYLVYLLNGHICIGHWMPLPAAPKKEW